MEINDDRFETEGKQVKRIHAQLNLFFNHPSLFENVFLSNEPSCLAEPALRPTKLNVHFF